MKTPSIDVTYLIRILTDLLDIPSPTGLADPAITYVEQALRELDLQPRRTVKGALVAEWAGQSDDAPRALTAHADTLGAMVKEIKGNGRLILTNIGGFAWNTVEGEGCQVFTTNGRVIRGSLLLSKASAHVYGKAVGETKRSAEMMEVRLDERTISAGQTRALGIEVGDFVAFDPRVEVSDSGFIRSRHLDDKAGIASVLAAVKAMQEAGISPAQRVTLHISHYEEVGHGAATGFPPDLAELVAVDMAAVGDGQMSDEFHVTICAKDSGGPYHHGLTQRLRKLAQENGIPHKMDIYPYYGSDGEAFWRAGGDVQVALIGPGVDASHSYERTHTDALVATVQLVMAYLRG
ncbi:MAG TPA: M42 family metallopeptidase [Caldilineae bacterium]|nr:M42 family metallopeptidase [Caldilineae bacterium]